MTVRFGTETHGMGRGSWWRCAKRLPSHWCMAASGPFPLPGQNLEAGEVLTVVMPLPSYCSFFLLRKSALVWSVCHQALAPPTGFWVFLDPPVHSLVSSPHFSPLSLSVPVFLSNISTRMMVKATFGSLRPLAFSVQHLLLSPSSAMHSCSWPYSGVIVLYPWSVDFWGSIFKGLHGHSFHNNTKILFLPCCCLYHVWAEAMVKILAPSHQMV